MKIKSIYADRVLNSEGSFGLQCQISFDEGEPVFATVSFCEECDLKASIELINKILAPQILQEMPESPIQLDELLVDIDGTKDRNNIGKSCMLVISMAFYKAFAKFEGMNLFDYIATLAGYDSVSLPIPFISILGQDKLVDDYFVVPYGAKSINKALEVTRLLIDRLEEAIANEDGQCAINERGVFVNPFSVQTKLFSVLNSAIKKVGPEVFGLGINISAEYYEPGESKYLINKSKQDFKGVIEFYSKMIEKNKLFFIEDPLDPQDWQGWINLNISLEDKCNFIANNLIKSRLSFMVKAIEYEAVGTIAINPMQVGTITETIQLIKLCQENGVATVLQATDSAIDSFVADLAVGSSVNYTKFGGLSGGGHATKYNRLLEIEKILIKNYL